MSDIQESTPDYPVDPDWDDGDTSTIIVTPDDEPPAAMQDGPASATVAEGVAHQVEGFGTTTGIPVVIGGQSKEEPEPENPKKRSPQTALELDLKAVCNDYVTGLLKFEGNGPTPHNLAREIARRRTDGTKVSGGAVSACLIRWEEIRFCTLTLSPLAFENYTEAARELGLNALKELARNNKAAAKKAMLPPKPSPATSSASAAVAPAAAVFASQPEEVLPDHNG